MDDSVYKILTPDQWQGFQNDGQFIGSEHDIRDGFIHLCPTNQIISTANKYFATDQGDDADAPIIVIDYHITDDDSLKWEEARGGILFPHLYGSMKTAQIIRHVLISPDPYGHFKHDDLAPLFTDPHRDLS